jgi:hypothetical protein
VTRWRCGGGGGGGGEDPISPKSGTGEGAREAGR